MFSSYCLAIGHSPDADAWLSSIEEMDRRVASTKGASRMTRRKLMMFAEARVFIEWKTAEIVAAEKNESLRPSQRSISTRRCLGSQPERR